MGIRKWARKALARIAGNVEEVQGNDQFIPVLDDREAERDKPICEHTRFRTVRKVGGLRQLVACRTCGAVCRAKGFSAEGSDVWW